MLLHATCLRRRHFGRYSSRRGPPRHAHFFGRSSWEVGRAVPDAVDVAHALSRCIGHHGRGNAGHEVRMTQDVRLAHEGRGHPPRCSPAPDRSSGEDAVAAERMRLHLRSSRLGCLPQPSYLMQSADRIVPSAVSPTIQPPLYPMAGIFGSPRESTRASPEP
jgi:hypothetical protein